jgi:uncharacterized FlaG/YvyC family protein
MLVRTLKKIVKNSISVAPNVDPANVFSPKTFFRSPVDRKKTEIHNHANNTAASMGKVPEDNPRRRFVNEKLQRQVEEKNKQIEVMEKDKQSLLEELKQFYVEVIEMLKLDHVFLDFKGRKPILKI